MRVAIVRRLCATLRAMALVASLSLSLALPALAAETAAFPNRPMSRSWSYRRRRFMARRRASVFAVGFADTA